MPLELQFILFCFNLLSQVLQVSATGFSYRWARIESMFLANWTIVTNNRIFITGWLPRWALSRPHRSHPTNLHCTWHGCTNAANWFYTIAICFRIPGVCCDVVVAIYEEAASDWLTEVPLVFSLDDPSFSLRSTLLLSSSPSLSLSPSKNLITRLSSFSSCCRRSNRRM